MKVQTKENFEKLENLCDVIYERTLIRFQYIKHFSISLMRFVLMHETIKGFFLGNLRENFHSNICSKPFKLTYLTF